MKTKRLFSILFFGFFLITCDQEPLFWDISLEYPPIEPIIGGVPTEIVEANGKLYVANRKSLWKYDLGASFPIWEQTFSPGSPIKAIAATGTTPNSVLYVLYEGGSIYSTADGAIWSVPVVLPGAQQIYGANDRLFAGDGSAVYVVTSSSTQIINSGAAPAPGGLLRGAAYAGGAYYICTSSVWGDENTGIFRVSGTTATKVYPSSGSSSVKGIIAAGSTIVAVNAEGHIIYGNSGTLNTSLSTGVKFTGGMAVWGHGGGKKILLGLQGGGSKNFVYGYRELDLDLSGNVIPSTIFVPGTTGIEETTTRTTSIDPGSGSAIGKHPVTALYVIPSSNSRDDAGRPIIVASTQQNGVWSYRVRRGTPQWNGEDNTTY
ncbi:MAG: hypothetical protein LBP69_11495 [Treponema sp.]|jgi:hypothetical protein|nr:hypothetical protein [Treponema sp.]